jgi:hypothetical protein
MPATKNSSRRQSKTLPDIHVDDRFLQDHLRDVRAEMSWRRELEFRLMQFMLIFYPILGTAIVELFKSNIGVVAFSITALGALILIVIATIVVTSRIDHEHETYADLGKQVQLIWLYFGLFEPGAYLKDQAFVPKKLLDEKTGLGQGPGYKKTKGLIWVTSITMIVILTILTGIKIFIP